MNTGPSKEELENYWKTSRAYFDELAKYYQTADPEYYKKYISPFYSNPLNAVSSSRSAGQGIRSIVLSVIGIAVIAIAGAGIFYFSQSEKDTPSDKKILNKQEGETPTVPENNEETGFPDDDFIIASKYIAEKDYDKAEEHLRNIKPGSKNYKEAQQLLESIKFLRKYDK
jgi:hypothetical protein